jgi:hypothetical protein
MKSGKHAVMPCPGGSALSCCKHLSGVGGGAERPLRALGAPLQGSVFCHSGPPCKGRNLSGVRWQREWEPPGHSMTEPRHGSGGSRTGQQCSLLICISVSASRKSPHKEAGLGNRRGTSPCAFLGALGSEEGFCWMHVKLALFKIIQRYRSLAGRLRP